MKCIRFVAALAVALVLGGSAIFADAFTEPVSDRIISGQVSLPGGGRVEFKVLEGQLFKIYDVAGKSFGLAPYLLEEEGLRARIRLFEITEPGSGLEGLRLLREFDVDKKAPAGVADSVPGLLLEITEVRDGARVPTKEALADQETGLAYTATVSDKIIAGRLTLPEGQVLGFRVAEGQMFKVRDLGGSYYYGVSPYVVDESEKRVQFNVFEISERAPGLEAVRFLESVEVHEGLAAGAGPESRLQVALTGLSTADPTERQQLLKTASATAPVQKAEAKKCCVTCDGVQACGCAVQHSCGSCCVPGLCCTEP